MLGFQGGVSIPLVKGGVKAPPAKRQCRAGPKAGARRGFPPNALPTPNENDILSQKAEQTIQFCWPDNSWNINARFLP